MSDITKKILSIDTDDTAHSAFEDGQDGLSKDAAPKRKAKRKNLIRSIAIEDDEGPRRDETLDHAATSKDKKISSDFPAFIASDPRAKQTNQTTDKVPSEDTDIFADMARSQNPVKDHKPKTGLILIATLILTLIWLCVSTALAYSLYGKTNNGSSSNIGVQINFQPLDFAALMGAIILPAILILFLGLIWRRLAMANAQISQISELTQILTRPDQQALRQTQSLAGAVKAELNSVDTHLNGINARFEALKTDIAAQNTDINQHNQSFADNIDAAQQKLASQKDALNALTQSFGQQNDLLLQNSAKAVKDIDSAKTALSDAAAQLEITGGKVAHISTNSAQNISDKAAELDTHYHDLKALQQKLDLLMEHLDGKHRAIHTDYDIYAERLDAISKNTNSQISQLEANLKRSEALLGRFKNDRLEPENAQQTLRPNHPASDNRAPNIARADKFAPAQNADQQGPNQDERQEPATERQEPAIMFSVNPKSQFDTAPLSIAARKEDHNRYADLNVQSLQNAPQKLEPFLNANNSGPHSDKSGTEFSKSSALSTAPQFNARDLGAHNLANDIDISSAARTNSSQQLTHQSNLQSASGPHQTQSLSALNFDDNLVQMQFGTLRGPQPNHDFNDTLSFNRLTDSEHAANLDVYATPLEEAIKRLENTAAPTPYDTAEQDYEISDGLVHLGADMDLTQPQDRLTDNKDLTALDPEILRPTAAENNQPMRRASKRHIRKQDTHIKAKQADKALSSKNAAKDKTQKNGWRWRDMLGGLERPDEPSSKQADISVNDAPLTANNINKQITGDDNFNKSEALHPDHNDVETHYEHLCAQVIYNLTSLQLTPAAIVDEGTVIEAAKARVKNGPSTMLGVVNRRLNAPVSHLRAQFAKGTEFTDICKDFVTHFGQKETQNLPDYKGLRKALGSAQGRAYLLCAAALTNPL